MPSSFKANPWAAAALTVGILAMLVLLARDLRTRPALVASAARSTRLKTEALPLAKIDALFSSSEIGKAVPAPELVNPFYTTFFQPLSQPKPQAPTTRKVELVYQGFYESAGGRKQAYVKAGDALTFAGPGEVVVADLAVSEITLRTLVLTNKSGQANTLLFKAPKEVEVPLP
jgi:hypothetical protein